MGGKSFSVTRDVILIYLVPFAKTTGGVMAIFETSIFVLGTTVISDSPGRLTSRGKIISITQSIGKVFYVVN